MPDSLLSQAIKEAYASAPDDAVIVHTLELRHAAFITPIRVCLGHSLVSARLEATAPLNPNEFVDFQPFAFRFKQPDVQTEGLPEMELEIDNVTREIEEQVELAASSTEKVDVTYREYLAADLATVQNNPPLTLQLKQIEANDFRVTGRAGFRDLLNRNFPAEEYTWTRFPGLAR